MAKFNNLKEGQILSETQFYRVQKIAGNKVQLGNSAGDSIVVDNKYAESCLISAHDYDKTELLSRTDLADKVLKSPNMAITVSFQKKVEAKDVIEQLSALYPNTGKMASKADFDKKVKATTKSALEGEERVMRGYHTGSVDDFGRIQFTDMEVLSGHNMRQVDPRTLNYAIINNIMYKVK